MSIKMNLISFVLVVTFGSVISVAGQMVAANECEQLPAMKKRLETLENRLKDFPNFARYREDNMKVKAPAKGEKRVVFMGDSITDSWDREDFGGFFPGKPYINRGISGQTTPQMLIRFRSDVIALKPKAVVILAGTNDIAGNTGAVSLSAIQDNIAAMSELATLHKIKVVLSAVMPVNDYSKNAAGEPINRTTARPPEKIRALNEWIKTYAVQNGHVYLDYYAAFVDDKGFMKADLGYDGLHPNKNGYAIMAPLAEEAIRKALK